jgi:hypothetical protein
LVRLVEDVLQSSLSAGLFVVTSLWSLGFTRARNHQESFDVPVLLVTPDGPEHFHVEWMSSGRGRPERLAACTLDELEPTVRDLLRKL